MPFCLDDVSKLPFSCFKFLGSSLARAVDVAGSKVGHKICQAICRATVEHLPSQNGRQPRAEYGSNTHFNQNLNSARAILPEESHPDIYPKRVKKHLEH